MIRKIFTHKFLPVIAVFMLVLFTLTTSCFAGNIELDNNQNLIIPDEYLSKKYVFFNFSECFGTGNSGLRSVFFYASDYCDFTISNSEREYISARSFYQTLNTLSLSDNASSSFSYSYFANVFNGNNFDFDLTGDIVENSNSSFTFRCFDGDNVNLTNYYYSNFDVLDSSGNVVFQKAPQETFQVELMKPTQVEEIPAQIVGIVKIVLPIFLTIFGVLLVLYLIKSKNLLQL